MTSAVTISRRWWRDRLRSTIGWTLGNVSLLVATAAFYPSLGDFGDSLDSGAGMSSLLGLGSGIDPSSPLGYLWISLYANIFPWVLMGAGIAAGAAAIAGDEDTGALEYLLARPVSRTAVVFGRFAGVVAVLAINAVVSALSLALCLPVFELTDAVTTVGPEGGSVTSPGATVGDVAAGTLPVLTVALGSAGVAFLLGAATGRRSVALGGSTGFVVGGYLLYTLSNTTGSLEALTWFSPWRWYVEDAMLINGLSWSVVLPLVTAGASLLVGWQLFLRRDLRNP